MRTDSTSNDQPPHGEPRIIDVEPQQQRERADVATSVFLAPRITDDEFAYRSPRYQGQRLRAALDGDRIVATFRSFDTFLTVPGGGAIAANAVSSVTVLPRHRRRRLLTTLMRADLAAADDRGAPVSILIPSEAPIYGRFGFGPAAHTAAWQIDARAAVFRHTVPGRLEVLRYEELRPRHLRRRSTTPARCDRPQRHLVEHGLRRPTSSGRAGPLAAGGALPGRRP